MKTIYKYPLHGGPGDSIVIEMPRGAVVKHFGAQGGTPTIWAEVNPRESPTGRRFMVIGTGHKIPTNGVWVYRGTMFERGPWGELVWHLYEGPES